MNSGYDVELLFEQRLRQLGYEGACRPAREDCGVDYVLFTSKGWMGIQVKSARRNNINTTKRGRIQSAGLRIKLGNTGNRTVEYFKERGVTVLAMFYRGVFYLLPIELSAKRSAQTAIDSPFREAWYQVLGPPVVPFSQEEQLVADVQQLETLYATD